MKNETQESIDDEVNEDELYNLDKMILDEKSWRECEFENNPKIHMI